jgi:hypothetical protein
LQPAPVLALLTQVNASVRSLISPGAALPQTDPDVLAMPIIGIDLGTSNSAAAVLRGGRPVIIPSALKA